MPDPNRPVIVVVDDDPIVLRAVRRDLLQRYSEEYRVVANSSASAAFDVLSTLHDRREQPALLLVDQQMPEMTGTAFLEKSLDLFPAARRVLLTAYADTEVAITAINDVGLDHYLVKPWDPPEERLYPVLDELLQDWRRSYRAPYDGIQIIGHRFAPATHRLRDLLTRHQLPFRFVDVELGNLQLPSPHLPYQGPDDLPVALLPDGGVLVRPTEAELVGALRLGGAQRQRHYDLVIVGGGPAGLAAAVYSSSEGLSTMMLDSYVPGGQAGMSSRIENYLGFPAGISGADLTHRAVDQARRFGTDVLSPVTAVGIERAGRARIVELEDGRRISAGTVLLATGLSYSGLEAPGADRFDGAGVYFGATTAETANCTGQEVFVVGGGNSAGQAALYFARHAERVTMIVRAPDLEASMSWYLTDEIHRTPNIRLHLGTTVQELHGDDRLVAVTLARQETGETWREDVEFLFTFLGAQPRTEWLDGVVRRDESGFLLTGSDLGPAEAIEGWDVLRAPLPLETSVPGIFAAGDVRAHSVKRLASGVGEGAMAVALVHRYRAES